MTHTPTLKPCPFCGGQDVTIAWTRCTDEIQWHNGQCNDCKFGAAAKDTEAEAITAWNTRTEAIKAGAVQGVIDAARVLIDYCDSSGTGDGLWTVQCLRTALSQLAEASNA